MSAQPFKYSPALEDPQTLKASLIDRKRELNRLLKGINQNTNKEVNQHFLLVGPRGIGKSYLLLLLHHTVQGNIQWDEYPQTIEENWCSALFAEEEYGVNSLSDILATTLKTLKGTLGDQNKTADLIEKAKNNERKIYKEIVKYLRAWRKNSEKKILLLIDNLQEILPHLSEKEQSFLRKILTKEDIFMMVGGTPSLFKSVTDYEKPFYHFFDSIRLEELNKKEVKDLLKQKLRLNNKDNQLTQIEDRENRLDALIHLTGGNPRSVISLYKIVVEAEIPEVEENFKQLIDELTPYFQARLQNLSKQQREILDCIAQKTPPISPTEIANSTGSKVNSINSQLKRLKDKRLVKQIESEGRKANYDLTERLFRYWRQMRTEAGRKKLNFIVRFIEAWFTPEELKEQARNLVTELDLRGQKGKETVRKLAYITEAIPSSERFTHQNIIDAVDGLAHDNLNEAKQKLDKLEKDEVDKNTQFSRYLVSGVIELRKKNFSEALQIVNKKLKPLVEESSEAHSIAFTFQLRSQIKYFSALTKDRKGSKVEELREALKDIKKTIQILSEVKNDTPSSNLSISADLCLDISLTLSRIHSEKGEYEEARQALSVAINQLPESDSKHAQIAIGRYVRSLLDINKEFATQVIQKIDERVKEEKLAEGLEEFMKPYIAALEYLETKDKKLLNKLPPQFKDIAKEIIGRLMG